MRCSRVCTKEEGWPARLLLLYWHGCGEWQDFILEALIQGRESRDGCCLFICSDGQAFIRESVIHGLQNLDGCCLADRFPWAVSHPLPRELLHACRLFVLPLRYRAMTLGMAFVS